MKAIMFYHSDGKPADKAQLQAIVQPGADNGARFESIICSHPGGPGYEGVDFLARPAYEIHKGIIFAGTQYAAENPRLGTKKNAV